MYIVWYAMYGLSGYGMRFYVEKEANIFADWMKQFPSIYSDIMIEKR